MEADAQIEVVAFELQRAAESLAALVAARCARIVFAESCTAGLVAATLAQTPGISQWLCGAAVTYRNQTKMQWLGVAADLLEDPGPVSAPVAVEMARRVLERTLEADHAWSVTGHLGPNAPTALDGVVFVGGALRVDGRVTCQEARRVELSSELRRPRQYEAALAVVTVALRDLRR